MFTVADVLWITNNHFHKAFPDEPVTDLILLWLKVTAEIVNNTLLYNLNLNSCYRNNYFHKIVLGYLLIIFLNILTVFLILLFNGEDVFVLLKILIVLFISFISSFCYFFPTFMPWVSQYLGNPHNGVGRFF